MSGYQKYIAVGNVTKDPEVHETKGGKSLAKFSIAINGYDDRVTFVDVVWWEPKGGLDYVLKGTPVLIEGELENQSWEKDGVTHRRTVVNTRCVKLLGGKSKARDDDFNDFK